MAADTLTSLMPGSELAELAEAPEVVRPLESSASPTGSDESAAVELDEGLLPVTVTFICFDSAGDHPHQLPAFLQSLVYPA